MRADSSQVYGAPVIHAPREENDRGLSTAFASPLPRLRPFTAVHGRALSRGSCCPTLTHLASVACGIQPFHSACVSVMTGARESKNGSSSSPPVMSTIVTLLLCSRFL